MIRNTADYVELAASKPLRSNAYPAIKIEGECLRRSAILCEPADGLKQSQTFSQNRKDAQIITPDRVGADLPAAYAPWRELSNGASLLARRGSCRDGHPIEHGVGTGADVTKRA